MGIPGSTARAARGVEYAAQDETRRDRRDGLWPPYLIYNKGIVLKTRPRPQDIAAKNHPQNFVKNYEKNLKKALTHTGVLLYDSQAPVKGRSLR